MDGFEGILKKKININWGVWGIAIIFFAVVAWVSGRFWTAMPKGAMEQGGPVPMGTTIVGTISTVCWVIAGVLALVALASLALKVIQGMQNMVEIEDVPEGSKAKAYTPTAGDIELAQEQVANDYPVYGEIAENAGRMNKAIREIVANKQEAVIRIQDAIEFSDALARLAEGAARKAVEIDNLAEELREVAFAVRAEDRDKMSEFRGSFPDRGVRALINMAMIDKTHGGKVVETLFTQVGTWTNQAYVIHQLINRWLEVFDDARAMIGELEMVAEEMGASEYVLKLDGNILQATQRLQLVNASPDARLAGSKVPRALPGARYEKRGRDRRLLT